MKLFRRNFAALTLAPALLAACGGEETVTDISLSGSDEVFLLFTTSPVLLASFLDSLDSVRTAANNLISSDVRYLLQDNYHDVNGNNRFDQGIDLAVNPLKHAGIHYAHAAGLTGAGQTIAISDNGYLTSHEVFDGKTVTLGAGISTEYHGTAVASIAAGNSATMIGVAPGADLILGDWDTDNLIDTANDAAAAGAVAYNNSWGYNGSVATEAYYDWIFPGTQGDDYMAALKNFAQDGIVIFAIDNDETISTIGLMAGLPIIEPDLEESWIAVVNGVPVMEDDDIVSATRISGACLEAAAWCLSADGSWTTASSSSNTSYAFGTGTSFASPTIAGSLALLAEAFPTLTPQELRIRLFAAADNTFTGFSADGTVELVPGFEHEYSDEWGHGFLDVAAALLPIGQSTITTSTGASFSPEEAMVVTGGASGDAVSKALASVDVISVDTLSAQFSVSASALVIDTPVSPLFSNDDVFNFDHVQNASYGAASFFGDGLEIPGLWGDSDISLAIYQRSEAGDDSFGLGASRRFDLDGATLEVSTAFGGDTAALLSDWNGGTDASLFSASMALSADISPVSQITFEAGYATGRETSVLGETSDVLMNSAAISLTRQNAFTRNDRFGFTVSLPAAVTSGSTTLGLPVASDSGAITYQSVPIDLSPDKREVRMALTYERPLTRRSSLGLSLAHAQNRGNIAGKEETGLMVSFNKSF